MKETGKGLLKILFWIAGLTIASGIAIVVILFT